MIDAALNLLACCGRFSRRNPDLEHMPVDPHLIVETLPGVTLEEVCGDEVTTIVHVNPNLLARRIKQEYGLIRSSDLPDRVTKEWEQKRGMV